MITRPRGPAPPVVLRRLAATAAALPIHPTPAHRHPPVAGRVMATTPLARTSSVEVERKFLLPKDLEGLRQRILAQGGKLLAQKSFTDSYCDTASFALTLADHWLRQRDDQWELKVPGKHVGGTAVYTELEEEGEIARHLERQLGGGAEAGAATLADLMRQHGIEPCATFGTSRESYALDDFHLDLDVASFGYGVGEIELMCADGDEAEAAAERIGELGTRLGVEMASQKGELSSKVAMVLEAERPAQYKALKEAGVL